jgi:Uma2 family endonuclease
MSVPVFGVGSTEAWIVNAPPKSSWLLTVDEYLAFEEQSEIRHEYVGGEIHAMAGASERHQIIVFNVASALREAARSLGCRTILNDVKLRVDDDDPYIKERPLLVVEVLSPTTAVTDRREKMIAYRRLPSLHCYLVVHQDEQRIKHHWRESADAPWEFSMVDEGAVEIPGLDIRLSFDEVYEGVELDTPA